MVDPEPDLRPEDLLDLVDEDLFARQWKELGLDVEKDLWDLQAKIMSAPRGGSVIPGTDGIRKLRFSPSRWDKGKSGALRILYVYFEEFGYVLLCTVYPKSVQDDVSDRVKKILNAAVARMRTALRRRYRRE